MSRVIVITSGKGGVGKTTVAANLGLRLAAFGAGVALVDADIGLNNLDVQLTLEHKVVFDLGDVIERRCKLHQALVKDERADALYVLPSAKVDADKITARQFCAVVSELGEIFDFVIIDCPAGIEDGFHRAVAPASEAIIVTTPHVSAVRDADKVLGLLTTYKIKNVWLAVNRLRGDMIADGRQMSAQDISRLLRAPLCAAVPEDDEITVNGVGGANEAYAMFANFMLGKSKEIFNPQAKKLGAFRNFLRKIVG
jgi:septum site-determining protein MinD